jgi:hypothetical protein
MEKIILDLCGGTGAWGRPFQEAGYDVRLVTLPEQDVLTYTPPDGVYGILAAPPCTEFSLAKNGSPIPRNLSAGLEIVNACLRIIWTCSLDQPLHFWAMENPVGLLRRFLGRPKFTFRQWEFGDPGVKPTDIWGYFNEPRKTNSVMPKQITKRYKSGKVNTMAWASRGQLRSSTGYTDPTLTRADLRAITPLDSPRRFSKPTSEEERATRAIINEKLYDTDKAKQVFTFRRKVDKGPVFWNPEYHWAPWHKTVIFKTKKGSYFEYDQDDEAITPTTEFKVREIIKNLDPDKYMKFFKEKVEEA